MEKVVTNELSKFLIILSIGVIGLSAVLAQMVAKIRGSFKPFQKSTIVYICVCLLCFALVTITTQLNFFETQFGVFVFYQLSFLVFGILHFHSMHKYLQWSGDDRSFWLELTFSIFIGLLGGAVLYVFHKFYFLDDAGLSMMASTLFFVIPFLIHHSFRHAVAIPPKIFKQWFYPLHQEPEEPDEKKLKNLLVISFELKKNSDDHHYTNFRAKAPKDMEFGELFYHFINDYNEQHPNEKIQYIQNSGEPHGWIFYRKPRWHTLITSYKNFEKTIFINNIRENDVIICNRCY